MKTNWNVFSYQARLLAVLCIITRALLCSYVFFIQLLSGLQQRDTHSFQLCKLENGCFHASWENVICCHGVRNNSHCFRKLGNVAILFGHISAFISVHSGAIRAESHRGVGQLGFAHFQGRESELPAGFIRNSCHLQHLYKHMLKSCFNTGEMLLETFYSSVFTCERANRPCDVNLLLLNIW